MLCILGRRHSRDSQITYVLDFLLEHVPYHARNHACSMFPTFRRAILTFKLLVQRSSFSWLAQTCIAWDGGCATAIIARSRPRTLLDRGMQTLYGSIARLVLSC